MNMTEVPKDGFAGSMEERAFDRQAGRKVMPKPRLREPFATLESQIIETLLAGHHEWRPDLPYPESHSDMAGAVRGLLRMFDVKRRPLAIPVKEMLSEHDKDCQCGNCAK